MILSALDYVSAVILLPIIIPVGLVFQSVRIVSKVVDRLSKKKEDGK